MSRRSPSTSRFVRRVRRTARSCLETIRSLVHVSHGSDSASSGSRLADEPYPDERDHGTAMRLESDPDPESPPGSKAALLDPATGPTCQGEILEHGCVPAQYVRAVLAEHGGRLKQRRFVDEYGWSPSTVSELLSTLEDDGVIERYRIGREKVIRLPDEEQRLAPTVGESQN